MSTKDEIRTNTRCILESWNVKSDKSFTQVYNSPSNATVVVDRFATGIVDKVRVIRTIEGKTIEC